jgi:hypothetical protein
MFLAGCGASSKSIAATPGQPLDPQGNWLFTFTGSDGTTALQFAGQLFELTSPVVTSNGMSSAPFGFGCGGLHVNGQASGTNTINLTVTESEIQNSPSFALTGTIADDQEHMSGTFSSSDPDACTATGQSGGTWTAEELAPVTDTWTGTASDGAQITAALTENTDQTSTSMGQVTGTVTVSGPCFTGPMTLPAWTSNGPQSLHNGEALLFNTAPDANGATLSMSGTVDPAAVGITGSFTVTGGPCDGQTFTANLTH